MQNGFRTDQSQKLQLRVDPRMVLGGQLMEMNSVELRSAIEAELIENPALEWLDESGEPLYLETILKSVAPAELKPSSEDREFQRSRPNDAEETDWLDFAGCTNTLEAHLEAQLCAVLDAKYLPIIQVVVAYVDDRGYLSAAVEEIALDHNFDLDEVEYVVSTLRDCEPEGIGSADLRECLLAQLKKATQMEDKLAYSIVKHCFDDLVDKNVRGMARKFKVMPEVIHAALEIIRTCSPYPADGYSREGRTTKTQDRIGVPVDLKIVRSEFGWDVEVTGVDPRDLIISNAYRAQMLKMQNTVAATDDEQRHLNTYIQRAKNYIDALEQRGKTLHKLGLFLIDHQIGFVTTGEYRFLKPLTRRQVAAAIGLHESTVSRATAGKHVQLANGEVVSFDVFFKPALRIQQMILEICATETPGQPLSDERIAQLLADRGVTVARRTVNKYRDRERLLSSRRRKAS
ncbi:MAG: hypothetical protein J0L72_12165 [Armatimonadetes bacterium]|nr:hypothetical protein [Armatimonadota bacterium]